MTDKPIEVTEADHVLVKRGLYYRPKGAGYTGRKDCAGLYPSSDARPDCGVSALPFKDAPIFAPACWQEVKSEFYEENIASLTQQLQESREENARLQSFVDKLKSSIGFNHNLRDCVTAKKTLTPNMFAYLAIHKVFEHLDALTTKADGGS